MSEQGAGRRDAAAEKGRERVVESLLSSWPATDEGTLARQRISSEVARFRNGQGASLPFRMRDGVAWVTVAPSSADLHREIESLRAWLLPSFGWEDPRQPFVAPGEASTTLAGALLAESPAGYFRWRCAAADYATVADRLARMRALAAKRPEHLYERAPSLLELRQQFRTALLTGARDAAAAAMRAIDHYQLDSAVNTHLMRVRMLDQFGEYAAIVGDPTVEQLLGLRLPRAVRSALVRAYHATLVAPSEGEGAEAAALAYRDRMHAAVGGLLAIARPEDGPEIARSLAYRAWVTGDLDQAAALLPTADTTVASLLQSVVDSRTVSPSAAASVSEVFENALRRGDLRALQDIAPSLLTELGASGGREVQGNPMGAIRQSLQVLPNATLAAELAQAGDAPAASPAMPQSWSELLVRLRAGDIAAAERFLSLDSVDRPSPERLPSGERDAALSTLEELLTAPTYTVEAYSGWVANVALPAFVEDFVSDPQFPRSELSSLYLQLLRLWAEHKHGSAYAPDGQLLLVLATAVLQHLVGSEGEVAAFLVGWWRARPIRAALPFLLDAIDVILDFTASDGPAQQLWLDGASLAARDSANLSVTERTLWRRLGLRAGFDGPAVEEVLPAAPATPAGQSAVDVLRTVGLTKIAIVSLHRRPAEEARDILADRTGASVFVVDETVAGPGTRAAQSADAVLFVWAATKHAVFRAFDTVRDRLIYVQGTGAGSIVLALERWVTIQRGR